MNIERKKKTWIVQISAFFSRRKKSVTEKFNSFTEITFSSESIRLIVLTRRVLSFRVVSNLTEFTESLRIKFAESWTKSRITSAPFTKSIFGRLRRIRVRRKKVLIVKPYRFCEKYSMFVQIVLYTKIFRCKEYRIAGFQINVFRVTLWFIDLWT